MAGELRYALMLDNANYIGGMQKAAAATNAMQASTRNLATAQRGGHQASQALFNIMRSLGFYVAPSATAAFLSLNYAIGSTREFMKSFAADTAGTTAALKNFGLAAAAVAVVLGSLAAAWKYFYGPIAQTSKTFDELDERVTKLGQNLQNRIREAIATKQITESEGYGLLDILQNEPRANLYGNVLAIQQRLAQLKLIPFDKFEKGQGFFREMNRALTSATLAGDVKERFDIQTEYLKTVEKINAAEGLTIQQREKLLQQAREARTAELGRVGVPEELKPEETARKPRPFVTEIERLGFIFNAGVRTPNDFNRQIADNTRTANGHLQAIAENTRAGFYGNLSALFVNI